MPHFKCCVCGVSDRADETRLPKRARRLPLVPRPEVLLLEFATQHTTVCQACARANGGCARGVRCSVGDEARGEERRSEAKRTVARPREKRGGAQQRCEAQTGSKSRS